MKFFLFIPDLFLFKDNELLILWQGSLHPQNWKAWAESCRECWISTPTLKYPKIQLTIWTRKLDNYHIFQIWAGNKWPYTRFPAGALSLSHAFLWHSQTRIFFSSKTNSVIWVREGANLAKLRHLGYEEFDYNKGNLFVR